MTDVESGSSKDARPSLFCWLVPALGEGAVILCSLGGRQHLHEAAGLTATSITAIMHLLPVRVLRLAGVPVIRLHRTGFSV